jgi:hypothetical protein
MHRDLFTSDGADKGRVFLIVAPERHRLTKHGITGACASGDSGPIGYIS